MGQGASGAGASIGALWGSTRLHESDGGKTDAFDATAQSGQAVEVGGLSLYRLPSRFPHKQLSEFTR